MSDKELIEKIEDAYPRVRKIGPDVSEYTPTTETVIECFLDGAAGEFIEDDVRAWLAEVERAAAARALEEFADQMTTGFNAGTLNAERRAIKREARARAEAYKEGRLT